MTKERTLADVQAEIRARMSQERKQTESNRDEVVARARRKHARKRAEARKKAKP
jgi:hypothetical protein